MPREATGFAVAVSGGADSAALLRALGELQVAPFRALPVRAVHVNHGLQSAAAQFEQACVAQCAAAGLPLVVCAVAVRVAPGTSIEAAARDARRAAFAGELRAGECLLTAHHALDQAETWLLQSLRGAGLKGLSAMPACRALGMGWHVRPLLEVTRDALRRFGGAAGGVVPVHDPMNDDLRFDRAYLRANVWPAVAARWPGAEVTLARAARHAADAQSTLECVAAATIERLRDGDALSVPGLRALADRERLAALRHFIAQRGVEPPSSARLTEAWRQIAHAAADHLPVVAWGAHALRRYRDRLFVTLAEPPALGSRRDWRHAATGLDLGVGLGSLRMVEQVGGLDASRVPVTLSVRQRQGGETLKLSRRARTRTVRHLCQEFGVLPWMRDALPMVFAGESLIAVGDLWLAGEWCVTSGAVGLGFAWLEPPIIA